MVDEQDRGTATYPDDGLGELRWWTWFAIVFFVAHFVFTMLTIGLRWEHVVLEVLFITLALWGPRARRFSMMAFPMAFAVFQYDNVRYLKQWAATVHVADVHNAALALFGMAGPGGNLVTPPEWFLGHTHTVLDFVTGASYGTYVPWCMFFGILLWWIDRRRMSRFAIAFWLLNTMGLITWFAFPVAPPWYAIEHGLGPAILTVASNPAGALRFDQLMGINFFQSFYARSAWVFGAMPSLHVGDPTIVLAAALGMRRRWWIPALLYVMMMGFSAVYLQHHYVLDILAGLAMAGLAWLISLWLHRRVSFLRKLADGGREQV